MNISDGSGWSCELDLWVIRDGRIAIGEAKTTSKLGDSSDTARLIESLRRSAEAVGAAQVVLATTTAAWHPSVETTVRSAFANTHQEVVFLSGLLL
jgi:hypothetical protein